MSINSNKDVHMKRSGNTIVIDGLHDDGKKVVSHVNNKVIKMVINEEKNSKDCDKDNSKKNSGIIVKSEENNVTSKFNQEALLKVKFTLLNLIVLSSKGRI